MVEQHAAAIRSSACCLSGRRECCVGTAAVQVGNRRSRLLILQLVLRDAAAGAQVQEAGAVLSQRDSKESHAHNAYSAAGQLRRRQAHQQQQTSIVCGACSTRTQGVPLF